MNRTIKNKKYRIEFYVRYRVTMKDGAGFIVYTLEFCPRCELLKEYLTSHNIEFSVADMSSAASLTEMRMNRVFVQEAPVLQRGKKFLTSKDIFGSSDAVNEAVITALL
jgi:glutaredoxin